MARSERLRLFAGWAGLAAVLGGAFGRAVCAAEPFPWWESDPFTFAPPLVGLTPTPALVLNLVIVLGAALTLAAGFGGPGRVGAGLLAAGAGVLGWHAARDPETVSAGADLAACVAAFVGVWAGSGLPGGRRVCVGVALGFGVMLAAVGTQQVFIEHPRTVATFEQTSEAFYRARGWDPAGPEAAMYEERLSHAEPTGWFGLTNVLATFAGASAVGLMALALSGIRAGGRRAVRLALVAGAVASAWTLMTTVSKGGIGAAALGALVVGVAWVRRPGWVGRAILAGAVCVVLAVVARGVVGERLGERSLLFRSQYMRGTLAVWAEHPVAGVGPGGFQDAYTRLKPARAPEEVSSPHSVGFDLVGVLGVGGLAWAGLLGVGYGRRAGDADGAAEHEPSGRLLARGAAGLVGAAVLLSAWVGRAAITPEGALALLAGGIGWAGIGVLVCVRGGSVRVAALAAGAVALMHGQLDLTPVWVVSAPAWGALVGLGAGAVRAGAPDRAGRWVGVAALAGTAGVLGLGLGRMAAWEGGLHRAAAWPREISAARLELATADAAADGARVALVAGRVGGWLRARVPARSDAVETALDRAALAGQDSALEGLRAAVAARPGHAGTRAALGRVLLTIAVRDRSADPARSARALEEAVASAEEGAALRPGDPESWSWLGNVYEQAAGLRPEDGAGLLARAAEAWERGDRLTPHAPGSAARVAEALDRAGRSEEAAAWAVRALGRDDGLDLDPRRRLSGRRRAGLEAIARGVSGGAAGDARGSGADGGP